MSSLQNFDYNGTVIQRRHDGFVNLTQMCQANGKQINDFLRLKSTKEYLSALELETGIPVTQLYQVFQGGNSAQGTWGHPLVALRLAQWISPKFAVWCDAHIFNLMATGSTSLEIDPIQEMQLKIELARLEMQKEAAIAQAKQSELALTQFRHTVTLTCPEPVQQKILGYQTVKEVEYRDRVILNDQLINDGSTVTKTALCHRYKILTKGGKPDFRKLNLILEDYGLSPERSKDAWAFSASIQENYQLKREYLRQLDDIMISNQRQMNLGE